MGGVSDSLAGRALADVPRFQVRGSSCLAHSPFSLLSFSFPCQPR